ncbi:MAG: sulfatase, partial [Bacteroidota bacterium]
YGQESEHRPKTPNILICVTDDQSWVHTSFAGEQAISTPAFDWVASEGLYFSNAFSASPSCSPSRGALITGQEMWRLGEAAQLYSAVPKELEEISFSLLLEEKGYFTGYTQKGWAPNSFSKYGWEHNPFGFIYNLRELQAPTHGIAANDYSKNFRLFLNLCSEDEPFLFWFGSSEPHRKFEANSGVRLGVELDKVSVPGFLPDVPEVRGDVADYLGEIKWVDHHLEQMIAMLEKEEILDNTLIIITSDNGMAFPSAKNNLYEYGIHMPLAIYWKEGIKNPGRVIDDLVSLTDLAPTLLEIGGADVPKEMTGKSLLEIFNSDKSGRVEKSRKYVFAGKERHTICREGELGYPQRSVRDYQYLYIRNYEPGRWPAGSPDTPSVHGWLYGDIDESPSKTYLRRNAFDTDVKPLFEKAMGKRPSEELYDILKDPACLHNLADEPAFSKDKKRLSGVLEKYLKRTDDPRTLTGGSVWDHFPYYFQNIRGVVPYSDRQ